MQVEAPKKPISLLMSWLPTWLHEAIYAEATRRQVGPSRIVAVALERELLLGEAPCEQSSGERRANGQESE